ncbi:MAG: winged helix-turn-helix transcriptional regulator [Bacteroidetes bacterium]|nr:winged helix-turn-helix transcriptional regulator [Bacteroidota bacterium]
MKATQAAQFDDKLKSLASAAKAIAHPARIAILQFLIENNNQTCKDIVEKLPFSQSTVSQHLAELKQAGYIEGKSFKTSTIYSIDQTALTEFRLAFEEIFGSSRDKRQLSLF